MPEPCHGPRWRPRHGPVVVGPCRARAGPKCRANGPRATWPTISARDRSGEHWPVALLRPGRRAGFHLRALDRALQDRQRMLQSCRLDAMGSPELRLCGLSSHARFMLITHCVRACTLVQTTAVYNQTKDFIILATNKQNTTFIRERMQL